jgi:hypothetical protein
MAQNQAIVFLSELFNSPLDKIVQYRRYMFECVWNAAVLIEKKPKLWESTLAKSDFVQRNSHAELTGYQSLKDWKRTRYHQPIYSSEAFANLSSYDS